MKLTLAFVALLAAIAPASASDCWWIDDSVDDAGHLTQACQPATGSPASVYEGMELYASIQKPTIKDKGDEVDVTCYAEGIVTFVYFRTETACAAVAAKLAAHMAAERPAHDAAMEKYR